MTRTKALVVVGCIMLALAAMAVMELKRESSTTPEGQIVTGSISMTAPTQTTPEAPAAPSTVPAGQPGTTDPAAQPGKNGALVSLDAGTLHPESSAPAAPATTPPAPAASATAGSAQSQTAPAAREPGLPVAPAARPDAGKAAPASAEPIKAEPVKTEPARTEAEKPVGKAETPKSDKAETPKSDKAEAPKVDKAEAPKADKTPEPAKTESANAEAARTEAKAIDTAGPVKVEPGQKAIVWTRMELSDKSVVFRMSGAEKLEAKAFVLPNPDRYVIDLQGEWAMRLPTVPANPFLRKIRVGKQESNTRMVMDLSGAYNCQMVRINPTTLEFRIR